MELKENSIACNSEFNKGYEKGYHNKDYTWEDGIKYAAVTWPQEPEEFTKGFLQGQQDRLRDEMQKWMC
ncbi:hypothetical protein [Desertivirga arenae]|uniref:hypothetical protein n=1 Tax=Desertivirga arenae TaxID=2810309 RepID=UPI001A963551|nr:hypothetical protein [Pedobacter sp. SYSU D00823]